MQFKNINFTMLTQLKNINIPVLLLSLAMAIGLWYVVVIGDPVDVQFDVQIEYKNIPSNLIITDGLIQSVRVHLRGPEALLRNIPLSAKVHVMDLSNLHSGKNNIPFTYLRNITLRAFEVINISPARITITAEQLQERNVKVRALISSPLKGSNIKIGDVNINPSSILVRGPSSTVGNINNIPLQVRIDPKAKLGKQEQLVTLDISMEHVTAHPPQVRVSYEVLSKRVTIELEKIIRIDAHNPLNYNAEPQKIAFEVEVPESLANSEEYLALASLSATPPALDMGESISVPLHVILPEGMTLIENLPKSITLKKLK